MDEPVKLPLLAQAIHRVYRISPGEVLNPDLPANGPAADLDLALAAQLKTLKQLFYASEQFDYAILKASPEFDTLCGALGGLHHFDPGALPSAGRKRAFWINLYNILVLHAVIAFGVEGSVNDASIFFTRAAYTVNGCRFSANDIEHGIMRANAGHPAHPGPAMRMDDPRRKYILPFDERIHFALNCAARSCPPIAAYDGDHLESQLDLAARAFINGGGADVDLQDRQVSLSRIFLWYRGDFQRAVEGERPLVRYIARYLADEEARAALIEAPRAFRVRYQRYDWGLNRSA